MPTFREILTRPVIAVLGLIWICGTAVASLFPGLLIPEIGFLFLGLAGILLSWRNKTLLFAGAVAMTRVEALLALTGCVLFLSFVSSGFVIPLLK